MGRAVDALTWRNRGREVTMAMDMAGSIQTHLVRKKGPILAGDVVALMPDGSLYVPEPGSPPAVGIGTVLEGPWDE